MKLEELNLLFQRDLTKLEQELLSYSSEHSIWLIDHQIANSAGNLALHLIGNLRHFVGLDLGGFPY